MTKLSLILFVASCALLSMNFDSWAWGKLIESALFVMAVVTGIITIALMLGATPSECTCDECVRAKVDGDTPPHAEEHGHLDRMWPF